MKNQEYILSLSYGKDSIACLGAIEELGLPLDRIVHAEVWATDTIHADFPEMVEFKAKADKIIKERYGIEVEHFRADVTYEEQFYKMRFNKKLNADCIYGFPIVKGAWCNDRLKMGALRKCKTNGIEYIGIAFDEPNRFHTLNDKKRSPLVEAEWTEEMCRKWCEENDLLSPIYTQSARGGCWFCHNQGVEQLRMLRSKYPEYWQLLLKWDKDSPVCFKPDGHTVHDFDKRFAMEEMGLVPTDRKFRWNMLNQCDNCWWKGKPIDCPADFDIDTKICKNFKDE